MTSLHPQAQALVDARLLEAEARAIRRTLGTIEDAEARHATRLDDDALTLREVVGYVDLRVYSVRRGQRRSAALDPQATRHTLRHLSTDRSRSVRRVASDALAAREAGDYPPVVDTDFVPADPQDFIHG